MEEGFTKKNIVNITINVTTFRFFATSTSFTKNIGTKYIIYEQAEHIETISYGRVIEKPEYRDVIPKWSFCLISVKHARKKCKSD